MNLKFADRIKLIIIVSVSLLIAMILSYRSTVYAANSALTQNELAKMTTEAHIAINEYRTANGLKPLEWDDSIGGATLLRATEISSSFSHTRPNGKAWYTADGNAKISRLYGENLATGYKTANDAVAAWIASPTHNENLLGKNYTKENIQLVQKDGQLFWAQELE